MAGIDVNLNMKGGTAGATTSTNKVEKQAEKQTSLLSSTLGKLAVIAGSTAILAKSSPAFAGTLKILEKTFMLVLKPLGDFVSRILRPLALMLLKWVANANKTSAKNISKSKELAESGKQKLSEGNVGGAVSNFTSGILLWLLGTIEKIPIIGAVAAIGDGIGKIISGWINDIESPTVKALVRMFTGLFLGPIGMLLALLTTDFSAMVTEFGTSILEGFRTALNWIVDLADTILNDWLGYEIDFDKVKDTINLFFDSIIEWWEEFSFLKWLKEILDGLKTAVEDFWKSAVDWWNNWKPKQIFDILKNAVNNWIRDSISHLLGGGSSSESGAGARSVEDAIISPNGSIITTDPKDYLIATKNPQELVGGSGTTVQTMNINVSVQEINSDMQVSRLADKLMEEVNRRLSYKTSGGI